MVVFHWTAPWHDVVRLPTEAAYDSCDLSGHTVLAPPNPNQGRYASSTKASYYFECDESLAGQTIYVACSLYDHCARGQKLKIRVSAAVRAYDPTTGDPLIHVTSLARIMALMGHRVDSQGGAHLDRGYQTEALANKTLELVWCLEAHCPQSAQDWDPTATHDSCIADVNNLAGFLSRKRPTPQISHARAYYATALDHFHNHCPTLGYLAMLHLTTNNATAAVATAYSICSACGGPLSPLARQVANSFASSTIAWPTDQSCAVPSPMLPSPPSPPPPFPPPPIPPLPPNSALVHEVRFSLVVAGSVETVDRTAIRQSVATAVGVSVSSVRLTLTAASVAVAVTIETASRTAAMSTKTLLDSRLQNATSAGELLQMSVEAITPPTVASVIVGAPPPPSPSPTNPPPLEGDHSVILIIVIIVAATISTCWLVLIIYFRCERSKHQGHSAKAAKAARLSKMSAAPAAVQVRWREDVEQFVPAVPPTQQVANLRFVPATHSGDRGQFSPPERLIAVEERTPRRERQREVEVKRPPRFHSGRVAPEERSSTSSGSSSGSTGPHDDNHRRQRRRQGLDLGDEDEESGHRERREHRSRRHGQDHGRHHHEHGRHHEHRSRRHEGHDHGRHSSHHHRHHDGRVRA